MSIEGFRCWILVMSCANWALAQTRDHDPFFRGIPTAPGYVGTGPYAISADGRVVVGASGVEGGFLEYHAFRWDVASGEVEILGSLHEELNSEAFAVSSNGAVVAGWGSVSAGIEAFRWSAQGGMIGLGDLVGGDHSSIAYGVSADGAVVVGRSSAANDWPRAFRWTHDDGLVAIDMPGDVLASRAYAVSADGRVIVGGMTNADYSGEAFRWTAQEGMVGLGDLAGGSFVSRAAAVSADGTIVVGSGLTEGGWEAFRWESTSGMIGLGYLGTPYSLANAVSADGSVVVGESITSTGDHRPFIWTSKDGMRDLQEVLQRDLGLNLGDFVALTYATGISGDGRTIIGSGFTRDGYGDGWIAFLGPGCRVDRDGDGSVDSRDVVEFLNSWVERSLLADWNYDAVVDTRDFIDFLNAWVKGC